MHLSHRTNIKPDKRIHAGSSEIKCRDHAESRKLAKPRDWSAQAEHRDEYDVARRSSLNASSDRLPRGERDRVQDKMFDFNGSGAFVDSRRDVHSKLASRAARHRQWCERNVQSSVTT
jgi:hypothetical protein